MFKLAMSAENRLDITRLHVWWDITCAKNQFFSMEILDCSEMDVECFVYMSHSLYRAIWYYVGKLQLQLIEKLLSKAELCKAWQHLIFFLLLMIQVAKNDFNMIC